MYCKYWKKPQNYKKEDHKQVINSHDKYEPKK